MTPAPRLWRGKWVVDLRAAGFGNRYVVGPATLTELEAVHACYRLVAQMRGERLAEPAQTELFAESRPRTFAAAVDAWNARKRYGKAGSVRWGATYTRLVRRELGDYLLDAFASPLGNDRLLGYVRELEARELSGRTIRNRVCILEQVLRFCVGRGWLSSAPQHPRLPPKAAPVMRSLTEAQFRELRADIFRDTPLWSMRNVPGVHSALSRAIYVERRRVFLSWLFYTGAHAADAEGLRGKHVGLDFGTYVRHNEKSARIIGDERFEMPEPLADDLRALSQMLGRPFFEAEEIAGGAWATCSVICQQSAARLGFADGAGPAIFRRSFAREMFLRGKSPRQVADYMGHVDERMLKEIYLRTVESGVTPTPWKRTPIDRRGPHPAPAMARVLQITDGAKGTP